MDVSPELLRRHDQRGPRYTSYPTVPAWRAPFGEAEHRAALADAADGEPIALYVHLPYCRTRCLYCGCHARANHRAVVVDAYLDDLERELALVFDALGPGRAVAQMHWGGGTPNHLTDPQLARLFAMIERHVRFVPGAELSVEADPRVATRAQLALLRGLGFGRVSFGA